MLRQHFPERVVDNAVLNDPDGRFTDKFLEAAKEAPEKPRPMSVLVCQLAVAAGRNPDWVSEVVARDGFCEVRRGGAAIPENTPIG